MKLMTSMEEVILNIPDIPKRNPEYCHLFDATEIYSINVPIELDYEGIKKSE
jgi:hypothetical protein